MLFRGLRPLLAHGNVVLQISKLLKASYSSLLGNYTNDEIINILDIYSVSFQRPSACGLAKYGISSCPFFDLSNIINERKTKTTSGQNITYPSVRTLFNESYEYSILNEEIGLPRWIALCYYQGYLSLGEPSAARAMRSLVSVILVYCLGFDGGYSTIYGSQLLDLYTNVTKSVSLTAFRGTSVDPSSETALKGSKLIVDATIQYLSNSFINQFVSPIKSLVYEEFNSFNDSVPCDPLGQSLQPS